MHLVRVSLNDILQRMFCTHIGRKRKAFPYNDVILRTLNLLILLSSKSFHIIWQHKNSIRILQRNITHPRTTCSFIWYRPQSSRVYRISKLQYIKTDRCYGVSNHRQLFSLQRFYANTQKASMFRITDPLWGNTAVTVGGPSYTKGL